MIKKGDVVALRSAECIGSERIGIVVALRDERARVAWSPRDIAVLLVRDLMLVTDENEDEMSRRRESPLIRPA